MPAILEIDGQPVELDGQPVEHADGDDCCCDDVTPGETCEDCSESITPAEQLLQLLGVLAGTCGDCSWWNETALVVPQSGTSAACQWFLIFTSDDWACDTGPHNVILQVIGTTVDITLNLAGGGTVLWRKTGITDCAHIGNVPFFNAFGSHGICDWSASSWNVEGV